MHDHMLCFQNVQAYNAVDIGYACKHFIGKESLSITNRIYNWRLFCTTHEYYSYLQLIKLVKMETIYKRSLKETTLIKRGYR